MACIKSAQRAALTALAPDAPYLAAGTMSGAVDMSFSASANIEIFRLDFQSDGPDLPLLASAPSPDRFNRLAWSRPGAVEGDSFSLGLLAGGLSDGSVAVWNPLSMINSEGKAEDAMVARLEKHTGPVCGLEFSELTPNRLASGAEQGELCIWDLKNPCEPIVYPPLKSVGSSAQAEISCLSWNPKFQHILATTSSNGMTVVWDLRNQKPLTSFSDSNRRKCSVLQWNPDMSTQLIVASDDDNSPSLRVWDVRKTISPVREFVGHSKGVIAMSWCPYDSSFLLTCAKDNRTICWDTVSGEIISELPTSANWNFDLHWYRKIPGVIAASSFDGKIGIYNLEFSGLYAAVDAVGAPARPRAPAPKWLKCPAGASFGFGGKLVSFHPAAPTQGAQVSTSEVHVHNLVIEQSLVSRSTEFEAAIQNGDKSSLRALCEKKSQESLSDVERETWGFLRVMFEDGDDARTKLLAHLGFEPPQAPTVDSTDELSQSLADTLNLDHGTTTDNTDAQFLVDNGDDFFNNPQPSEASLTEESISTNGQQIEQEMPGDVVPSDPSIDKSIQHALVVGDYKGAVNQCLAANRMADALVIAHAGGSALWESTRNHYLKNSISPYLKVVSAMVGNDLMSFVSTWPLSSWKETLALLCTFARKEEWNVLCNTLASRLVSVGDTLAATLCYICAGNIDKAAEIWSRNLKSEDGGKTYVDLLQDLMEKTITLALATGHKRFSASLSKLLENYAELLASQGLLKTAMEYLKLLGSDEHSHELAILRDRIAFSTEENDAARSSVSDSTGTNSPYVMNQSSYITPDHSQNLYQVPQPYNVPSNTYSDVYQQQPNAALGYNNTYQPQQPAQMFVPPSAPASSQQQQGSAPVSAPQQTVKTFTPTNLPGLKNPEQYQQPNTLGSQLYTGSANPPYSYGPSASYQSGPPTTYHQPRSPAQYQTAPPVPSLGASAPVPGMVSNQMFPHSAATNSTSRLLPSSNQGFVQRPGLSPVQPSSPTQAHAKAQTAPPAPPPTVQTADTSKVSAELRSVIATLTRLFDETFKALGGSQATQAKKREIEDNSRKIGALFAKLNTGDISPNVSSKLIQLCGALDSNDFATAMHLQVLLTTSDWDECDFWLAALKRMIKTRQNFRM
ncbi:protein transport protein SEC31 homolog B-like isoform X2 [Phragmites australis]|uniref:protein transport protein SEC31 homolog B-like isoform X2 n=1 Tax=Phragmites australis TaxID=29695 RepID=UPI002D78ED9B|nr:protein transport protein SEC31 homolog B-like isoform X2 [Phragmites australis]